MELANCSGKPDSLGVTLRCTKILTLMLTLKVPSPPRSINGTGELLREA